MSRLKGGLLYILGVFLLVFGNRNALSIFEGWGKNANRPEEQSAAAPSSMFGTIELNKNQTDSTVSGSTNATSIETNDVETATGSE